MKRLWIGIGILVLLLAMGIGLLLGSMVYFEELSRDLEQAGELAMTGNWPAAIKKAEESEARWKIYRRFWASFTDHEPVEEMEVLFSQLKVYQARQLDVDFATVCRHMSQLAKAIDESHGLHWWSIL